MSIAIIKKVKFDGARCPFSTFLRLQGDHHCACAQNWRHFSFFSRSFQTKKKIKALRPKMTKIASRGSCLNLIPFFDICSVDYLLFFHPGLVARVCAALLGPLRGRNSCCLWFWQLVFGVSLRAATSNLPSVPQPRAPAKEKA